MLLSQQQEPDTSLPLFWRNFLVYQEGTRYQVVPFRPEANVGIAETLSVAERPKAEKVDVRI